MQYTICSSTVESIPSSKVDAKLLFYFIMDNPDRVIYNNKILEKYQTVSSDIIETWLDLMTNGRHWKMIKEIDCEDKMLFIEACKISSDKCLIVNEKEVYLDEEYRGVDSVLDKYEALCELNSNKTIIKKIEGNTVHVTTGENSPINNEGN